MTKPVKGKVYLATADGPGPELVALPHGDFQEIGFLKDGDMWVDESQEFPKHGLKLAAGLTTSISFDAVHAPPLALYCGGGPWGVPNEPTPEDLTPAYAKAPVGLWPPSGIHPDEIEAAPFPKPSLEGLVKPPTPGQKKMLEGVELSTFEEIEDTTTPLLHDAVIKAALKDSLFGPPGWVDAGYIQEPAPLKWDDLVAAFEPVKVGLKKMNAAFESSVKHFQHIIAQHSDAIAAAYDGNPFATESSETIMDTNSGRAESLARLIPGIYETVKLPCFHGGTNSVWLAIQHLNDTHNPNRGDKEPWSREAIADWLETLDADLRVQDSPVLRGGDWVRGRVSHAVGEVVMALEAGMVAVRWERTGLVSEVHSRNLELHKRPIRKPAAPAPPLAHGVELGSVVYLPQGPYQVVGYNQALDRFHLLSSTGQAMNADAHVVLVAMAAAEEHKAKAEAMKKQAEQLTPPPGFLDSLKHPTLGMNDAVKSATDHSKQGVVKGYQVNTDTKEIIAYGVEWYGGPIDQLAYCPREELILVEAYTPPTDEPIIDWGSKEITKIHPNIY